MIQALFVEDTPLDMELLLRTLKKDGIEIEATRVETLHDLKEALRSDWDIILSDYTLLGFTAIEVLQVIKDLKVSTPVIIVSSAVSDETAVELMRNGASDFVRKENPARLGPAMLRELRDAKDRKDKHEELKRWEHLFQNASWGMSLASADHRVIAVNQAFAAMHGSTIEEWIGRPLTDMFHEDSINVFEELELKSNTVGNIFYESVHVRKDGSSFPVLTEVSAFKDHTGQVLYRAGNFQDITTRKRTEEFLRAREQQFRTLADSIPQLAWMANPAGEIFWFNQKWYEYTGSTPEEMKNGTWELGYSSEILAKVRPKWNYSLETGTPWEDVFQLKSKSGEYRWFLSRALPIKDSNNSVVSWFGTSTDINEQLKIEEELKLAKAAAEEANVAKSRFLANMSHEIRTPLGVMMGFAELALDQGRWSNEVEHYLSTIKRNGEILTRIIGEVLDLSKIEASKIEIEQVRIHLPTLLKEIISFLDLQASEKGIQLELKPTQLLPEFVMTDPTRLRQILINLIGNAIKFTDRGRVTVLAEAEPSADSEKHHLIHFTISDTGIGISSDQQQRLFTPFSQGDSSMTRKYGGSGLGLVLARELSKVLGGDIRIAQSEPGKGTTFVCTISVTGVSLKLSNVEADQRLRHGHSILNSDLSGVSVLLVEDSPDNQILFSRYLKKSGAFVDFANDGKEGLEKALASVYDVVLMDIQMPIMNGHEATLNLRKQGYSRPIIALTAHAMKEEREQAFREGFTDYLTKPLHRAVLIECILKCMSDYKLSQQVHGLNLPSN